MRRSQHPTANQAATLIELTIALGVMATVMVSLLGMLSQGFLTMRKAADISTEARIVQQLLGELQSIEWDRIDVILASEEFRTRYFDDQGIETARGKQTFTARIYPDRAPGSSSPTFSLPGDADHRIDRENHLRRFAIRITNVPGEAGEMALEAPEKTAFRRDFSGTVVRLRKDSSTPSQSTP
ncbi:MAG: Verru_Chthon cassette protein B [Verrucomicrobiae bacterium]|nr:Verru_Chthon cassette protein B [Verrucomicrobiae bacterium]